MIMELAYRAIILNPTISDDLKELTGTVLIDEIDAHLHPKWQWKVMDALTKTFPGVQFIVATHSPIVMSSAKNARIIVLDSNGEADYTDNAYGYTVDDVLRLRQSSDSMPKESKELSEELDEAVENDDFKKAKEIVDKARLEFGCNSSIYQGLKQYYELNRVAEDIG